MIAAVATATTATVTVATARVAAIAAIVVGITPALTTAGTDTIVEKGTTAEADTTDMTAETETTVVTVETDTTVEIEIATVVVTEGMATKTVATAEIVVTTDMEITNRCGTTTNRPTWILTTSVPRWPKRRSTTTTKIRETRPRLPRRAGRSRKR